MMNLPVTEQEIEIMESARGVFLLVHFLRSGDSLCRRDLRCSQSDAHQNNYAYAMVRMHVWCPLHFWDIAIRSYTGNVSFLATTLNGSMTAFGRPNLLGIPSKLAAAAVSNTNSAQVE
jgi:hypothetical protein